MTSDLYEGTGHRRVLPALRDMVIERQLSGHHPSQDRLDGHKAGIVRFPDQGQELEPEIVVGLVKKRPDGTG